MVLRYGQAAQEERESNQVSLFGGPGGEAVPRPPMPSVDPIAFVPTESRLTVPDDAQDASYLAASANISSFCRVDICAMMFLLCSHLTLVHDLGCVGSFCGEQSAGFGRLLRCWRWRSMKG